MACDPGHRKFHHTEMMSFHTQAVGRWRSVTFVPVVIQVSSAEKDAYVIDDVRSTPSLHAVRDPVLSLPEAYWSWAGVILH